MGSTLHTIRGDHWDGSGKRTYSVTVQGSSWDMSPEGDMSMSMSKCMRTIMYMCHKFHRNLMEFQRLFIILKNFISVQKTFILTMKNS